MYPLAASAARVIGRSKNVVRNLAASPQVVSTETVSLDFWDLATGKDLTKDIERGEPTSIILAL